MSRIHDPAEKFKGWQTATFEDRLQERSCPLVVAVVAFLQSLPKADAATIISQRKEMRVIIQKAKEWAFQDFGKRQIIFLKQGKADKVQNILNRQRILKVEPVGASHRKPLGFQLLDDGMKQRLAGPNKDENIAWPRGARLSILAFFIDRWRAGCDELHEPFTRK